MVGAMSPWTKLSIGLVAAFAAAWIAYGPLGRGAAYLDQVEARARAAIAAAELPAVRVHMVRGPLSRTAILSGPVNDFQREGIGSLPGLDARVAAVPGVAAVRWDEGSGGVPLLVELLGLAALAYLIGIGVGWLIFRPRHEGFL